MAQVANNVLKKFEAAAAAVGMNEDLVFYYPVYGELQAALWHPGSLQGEIYPPWAVQGRHGSWAGAGCVPSSLSVHARSGKVNPAGSTCSTFPGTHPWQAGGAGVRLALACCSGVNEQNPQESLILFSPPTRLFSAGFCHSADQFHILDGELPA